MYVKLPGGTHSPGGYIVPCTVVRSLNNGWSLIELSSEDGKLKWNQAVRNGQLISDIKVVDDE
jgi:hypothetical protein